MPRRSSPRAAAAGGPSTARRSRRTLRGCSAAIVQATSAPPVVPDDHGVALAQRPHERGDVRRAPWAGRTRAAACRWLRTRAGRGPPRGSPLGQCGQLGAPGPPELRKPVQQEHQRSLACLGGVQAGRRWPRCCGGSTAREARRWSRPAARPAGPSRGRRPLRPCSTGCPAVDPPVADLGHLPVALDRGPLGAAPRAGRASVSSVRSGFSIFLICRRPNTAPGRPPGDQGEPDDQVGDPALQAEPGEELRHGDEEEERGERRDDARRRRTRPHRCPPSWPTSRSPTWPAPPRRGSGSRRRPSRSARACRWRVPRLLRIGRSGPATRCGPRGLLLRGQELLRGSCRMTGSGALCGPLQGAASAPRRVPPRACEWWGARGVLRVLRRSRRQLLLDQVHDRGVGQRGDVAELPVLGDVPQQPAHDLAGAGLRQLLHDHDLPGLGDRADARARRGCAASCTSSPPVLGRARAG